MSLGACLDVLLGSPEPASWSVPKEAVARWPDIHCNLQSLFGLRRWICEGREIEPEAVAAAFGFTASVLRTILLEDGLAEAFGLT